jgi:hypothetical protein
MPKIIGTLDRLDQKLDWLTKFSIQGADGKMWLGARTKDHKALTDALRQHESLPPDQRPVWDIDYAEEESTGKNGVVYTNRYVTTAKTVEAGSPAAAPPMAGSKDAQIARAVAFKGAIEIVSASVTGKTQVTNLTAAIAHLTDEYEAILTNSYSEPNEEIIETVTEEQDSLFEEEV